MFHTDTEKMGFLLEKVLLGCILSVNLAFAQQSEVGESQQEEVQRVRIFRIPRSQSEKDAPIRRQPPSRVTTKYPEHGLPTMEMSRQKMGASVVVFWGKKYILKHIDGCNRTHTIGLKLSLEGGVGCDFKIRIHPHAVKFLDDHLHACAEEGLKRVGVTKSIAKVEIHSLGVFTKRRVAGSSVWSNHSLGAAIDLNALGIEFQDGTKDVFAVSAINPKTNRLNSGFSRCSSKCGGRRYNRTGKALFYDGFYGCIKTKAEEIKTAKRKEGISCTGGVLGCDYNGDHADHIHLSVPVCPKPRGVAEI